MPNTAGHRTVSALRHTRGLATQGMFDLIVLASDVTLQGIAKVRACHSRTTRYEDGLPKKTRGQGPRIAEFLFEPSLADTNGLSRSVTITFVNTWCNGTPAISMLAPICKTPLPTQDTMLCILLRSVSFRTMRRCSFRATSIRNVMNAAHGWEALIPFPRSSSGRLEMPLFTWMPIGS